MSRSKTNKDHLVDFRGNYKGDLGDLMTGAFCSFDSDDTDNPWAVHNVTSIDKPEAGRFIVHFEYPFPSDKYNVIVSCNSGFFRHHHATPRVNEVEIVIRDRDNNPANDAFVTVYCFGPA